MRKRVITIIFLVLTLTCFMAEARRSTAAKTGDLVFTTVGPAFAFGDIGGSQYRKMFFGSNDWVITDTKYLLSLGVRMVYDEEWGYKVTFHHGSFKGSDADSRNSARGYSFSSNYYAASFQGDYTIGKGKINYLWSYSYYAFAGLGVMFADTHLKGNLRPTDEHKPNVLAPIAPVGIGFQFRHKKFIIGTELEYQYLFTDFLDGLTTPYSKNNDLIVGLKLTLGYRFKGSESCNCVWN